MTSPPRMADDAAESVGREANPLIRRVDELIRRHQESTQKAVEEVPVLTEILEDTPPAPALEPLDQALGADLERVLLARLVPELDRQVAALRGQLETDIRRIVREAVAHALAARHPDKKTSEG